MNIPAGASKGNYGYFRAYFKAEGPCFYSIKGVKKGGGGGTKQYIVTLQLFACRFLTVGPRLEKIKVTGNIFVKKHLFFSLNLILEIRTFF